MSNSKTDDTRRPRQGNLILPPDATRKTDATGRKQRKRVTPKPAGWLAYLTLILLTIGSYAPMFSSDLIWSEYDEVERSPYQSLDSWTEAWTPEMIRREDPLSISSYFLEQQLPFDPAVSQHAINLLLHITAALLLLKVLEALKLPAAFSASLVFALHPTVLQTVFWSGYRSELMGLILLLAALYFGVRNRGSGDFFALIFISALGYLLHPATLLLPLLLGLCIFYQHGSLRFKDYNRLLPLFCLALFIGVWTQAGGGEQTIQSGERLSIYAQNLFFYLKQALLPMELMLFHPFNQAEGYNVGAQHSFLPFLLFIPFYLLIALNYKKTWARGILLGLTIYLLLIIYGLSHTGAFIDGRLAHEDHLQYLALPVLTALIICTAGGIARNMGLGGRVLWYCGFTLFVALQAALTASYAYAVKDRAQLWYDLAEEWPQAWLPKLALIHTQQTEDEAGELLTQSETIDLLLSILAQQPERVQERKLLARLYRNADQNTNALREYKRILRDAQPSNNFLREAAEFYDQLGLTWDARTTRRRMDE